MARNIPQMDSGAAVNTAHLLIVLDPDTQDPVSQSILDVVRSLFTQARQTKLDGIEEGAEVNLAGAQLQAAIDSATGSQAWRSAHTILRTAIETRNLLDGLLGTGWRTEGGGGGGISLDQAIDGVGAALAMLGEFQYASDTNTFTFALAANSVTAAQARANNAAHKTEWRNRIEAPHDPDVAKLDGATFTGAAAGIDPTAAEHFATKGYVDTEAHDSSSAGSEAEDHRRLSALEQKTRDLALREETDWTDVPAGSVGTWALYMLPRDTGLDLNAIAGYPWAVTQTIAGGAGGEYQPLLRIADGHDVTGVQISRVAADDTVRDPLRGIWGESDSGDGWIEEIAEGGFSYYIWTGTPALAAGDVLTVQTFRAAEHTVFSGDVTALVEHAADPGAHQDSPRRQESLGLFAPVGRRVYLTEDTTHPPMEQIHEVPLDELGPNSPTGQVGFIGATVADFSAAPVNGPVATADTSGFPGIMNAQRIAGIWQNEIEVIDHQVGSPDIYLAIGIHGALGAAAPTHIHLTGILDRRVELEQVRITGPIGGTAQRIMRTRGVNLRHVLFGYSEAEAEQHASQQHTVRFSLEYPPANPGDPNRFLASDGTLPAGTGHMVGEYESIGNGQWRSRGRGIIARLVAELASASDADKFALVAALHANPEVLYTENVATEKNDDAWLNIQLNRVLSNADLGKLIVIRIWNRLREAEAEVPVRRFLGLTPMNPADDQFDQQGLAIPMYRGDGRTSRSYKQGQIVPLFVGRPTEAVQTFGRIILGTAGFGSEQGDWRDMQIQIELRSL